jgi:hypothetical protein
VDNILSPPFIGNFSDRFYTGGSIGIINARMKTHKKNIHLKGEKMGGTRWVVDYHQRDPKVSEET